jgi:hypothetical protein
VPIGNNWFLICHREERFTSRLCPLGYGECRVEKRKPTYTLELDRIILNRHDKIL